MSCLICIYGEFDPNTAILGAPLRFEIERRQGEPGRNGRVYNDSLIQVLVSDVGSEDLEQQFAEVVNLVDRLGEDLIEFCRRPAFELVID